MTNADLTNILKQVYEQQQSDRTWLNNMWDTV